MHTFRLVCYPLFYFALSTTYGFGIFLMAVHPFVPWEEELSHWSDAFAIPFNVHAFIYMIIVCGLLYLYDMSFRLCHTHTQTHTGTHFCTSDSSNSGNNTNNTTWYLYGICTASKSSWTLFIRLFILCQYHTHTNASAPPLQFLYGSNWMCREYKLISCTPELLVMPKRFRTDTHCEMNYVWEWHIAKRKWSANWREMGKNRPKWQIKNGETMKNVRWETPKRRQNIKQRILWQCGELTEFAGARDGGWGRCWWLNMVG